MKGYPTKKAWKLLVVTAVWKPLPKDRKDRKVEEVVVRSSRPIGEVRATTIAMERVRKSLEGDRQVWGVATDMKMVRENYSTR